MRNFLAVLTIICSMTGFGLATAQSQPVAMRSQERVDLLRQFNDSLVALAERVSPAVVEVLVSGYGPVEQDSDSPKANTALIGRQHSLGSGVIVDPHGFIVTNAHVVEGAQRIRVMLSSRSPQSKAAEAAAAGRKTLYDARVIGVHKETDLALLKIDASGLPVLPVDPTRRVYPGQLVVAVGSPEGLEDSVTMGVVSSVARQPDPARAMSYIQTDAPLNHGSSGGPLVDIDGYLVGINTLMLSSDGGNQGIGFAIPARVVKFVYERLRKDGHVDRSEIGAAAQTITPLLAAGLDLPLNTGVIVSDVSPQGPAESAGLKVKDVVLTIDGWPIDSLPAFELSLYLHPKDQVLTMEIQRGSEKYTLHIPVTEQKHEPDPLIDFADPQKNLVSKLGLLAIEIDDKVLESMSALRDKSGVVVVAKAAYSGSLNTGLAAGDVIHSVNGSAVTTLEGLRTAVDQLRPGDAVVVQVERQGKMQYLAFEFE